ncbi:MAG: caspase family protein [Bacteroidota bacterium]
MSTPSIYALLVGIDKYLPPVPALDGCVNDMRAIRDYLEKRTEDSNTPLHLVVLENDQATRLNIVNKFETHLTQAKEGDIAFFYFSGHGSQERAHEIFWEIEGEDKKNETIVCYDSRLKDGMDLADKEIATLLDLVAKNNPQIIVVQDCCNSGSGTRGESKSRSVRDVPPKTRSLDSYILPRQSDGTKERAIFLPSESENVVVPNPRHIAMSAAQSFELAKETWLGGSPRGVFTYSFIEVLENAVGPLSYSDLMRRVQGLVKQRTFDQSPQIYATEYGDMDLVFLGGATSRDINYYSLTFDREEGWQIDGGAVHGLVEGDSSTGRATFNVFAEDASQREMKDVSMALGKVEVVQVLPQSSKVTPLDNLWLEEKTAYRARIHSMPIKGIAVNVKSQETHAVSLATIAYGENQEAKMYISLEDNAAEADYHLVGNAKQEYVISRKSDADNQPLVEQISGFTPESARKAIDYLLHIAKWERFFDLKNPGSGIFSQSVKIELFHEGSDQPIQAGPDGLSFTYQHTGSSDSYPSFRVKVSNNSGQRLYCSLLYLSSQFEVYPGLLGDGGLFLDNGGEVWALGGRPLKLYVKDGVFQTGRDRVLEVFKLMVSTQEFDPSLFELKELGAPKTKSVSQAEYKGTTRSIMFEDESSSSGEDWNTTQISLTIIRT